MLEDDRARRIREWKDGQARLEAQSARAAALAASAQALAEAEHDRVTKAFAAEEVLARVASSGAPPGPRHGGRPKRDRHGLRVIPGGMAAFAVLGAGLRWPFRAGLHRAVSIATLAAVGTGAGLAAEPSLIQGPTPPAFAAVAPHHRHHSARLPPVAPQPDPGQAAVRLVRHHRDRDVRRTSPVPSPVASPHSSTPAPDPSPSASPDPSPSPTDTPAPSPSPTCHGNGNHCGNG
jgi:hypothetical protein